jgi:flagellar motor switch protein FliM
VNQEVLSQAEVEALVQSVASGALEGAAPAPTGEVRDYDFNSQVHLSRGRMPTLERINERFGQLFRKSLFNLLRRSPEITIAPLQIKKFGDYVNSLATPTSLNLVRVSPLRGTGLVVMDPKLVFSLVDNFFGGSGRISKIDSREFTATEIRIVHMVLKHVFSDLREAWGNIAPIEMEYLSSETNPHFASVVGPTEIVVITSARIDLDGGGGELHITMPYAMLEPLREVLDSGKHADQDQTDERWATMLRDELEDAEVELTVSLGNCTVTVSELVDLKAGDILPCDFTGSACVRAEDIPIFRGSFGVSRGQQSVKYESRMSRPRNDKLLKVKSP